MNANNNASQTPPRTPGGGTDNKTVLITGGARRIGRAITGYLHTHGWNVIIHYRRSADEAATLAEHLNRQRARSATTLCADFRNSDALKMLADNALAWQGRIDALVNNASAFFPTPIDTIQEEQWDTLIGSNVKAPLFLAHCLRNELKAHKGSIVNIVDIHSDRPLKNYAIYSISKAALAMLTRVLARELAPGVRCNGVSPGAILWPEVQDYEANHRAIIARTALKREGTPEDIAKAVKFLLCDAPYITGQILAVDGGRTLSN